MRACEGWIKHIQLRVERLHVQSLQNMQGQA